MQLFPNLHIAKGKDQEQKRREEKEQKGKQENDFKTGCDILIA